jgi:predicted ATPase
MLWCLGYADQSLLKINEALAQAQELSHAPSLVVALHLAAHLYQLRREVPVARQRAETGIALAKEHGLELWMTLSAIYGGRAQVEEGTAADGIEEMRAGIAIYQSTGAKLWRPHFLCLLAEALAKAGQPEEGLSVLAEALAETHDTGEHYYEAELWRTRGELLIRLAGGRRLACRRCRNAYGNCGCDASHSSGGRMF